MKHVGSFSLWLAVALGSAHGQVQNSVSTASPSPLPASTARRIVDAGQNHRKWQWESYERAPDGHIVTRPHTVVELAAGLNANVPDAQGQAHWVPTREVVEPCAQGAQAHGAYSANFANNINSYGAVNVTLPSGQKLVSNILGLGYWDIASGQAVLISQTKDCQGQIRPPNQVVYLDAFEGVPGSVVYTYKKGGMSQDVVLLDSSALPDPAAWGLSPETTRLEVFTEFVAAPEATVTWSANDTGTMADQDISWGTTRVGHGRAFDLSGQTSAGVAVEKRYINVNGRRVLVEMIPVKVVAPKHPQQSSIKRPAPLIAGTETNIIPAVRKQFAAVGKPMQLADAAPMNKGYLIDYQTLNASETDFVFAGDQDYLISGDVNLMGETRIESGSVLKFDTVNGGALNILGTLNCQTGPWKPAILTSTGDSTVGESMGGGGGAACTGTLALHVQNDWSSDLQSVYVYDENNNWNMVVDDESSPAITAGNSADYSFTAGLGQPYYYCPDGGIEYTLRAGDLSPRQKGCSPGGWPRV